MQFDGARRVLDARRERRFTENRADGFCRDLLAERRLPGYRHAQELAALCSQRVRTSLYEHGITLSNYWQLREG